MLTLSRIPIFKVGILLFFAGRMSLSGSERCAARILAAELLDEGNIPAAMLETRRSEALHPPPSGVAARIPDTPLTAPATSNAVSRRRPAEVGIGWWIWFYRTQIGPALGARCSMHPSCSEYCMQAVRRHGLLGLAIYADRAVREPDVVKDAQNPVRINGRQYFADPLCDHDFWLRHQRETKPDR